MNDKKSKQRTQQRKARRKEKQQLLKSWRDAYRAADFGNIKK